MVGESAASFNSRTSSQGRDVPGSRAGGVILTLNAATVNHLKVAVLSTMVKGPSPFRCVLFIGGVGLRWSAWCAVGCCRLGRGVAAAEMEGYYSAVFRGLQGGSDEAEAAFQARQRDADLS